MAKRFAIAAALVGGLVALVAHGSGRRIPPTTPPAGSTSAQASLPDAALETRAAWPELVDAARPLRRAPGRFEAAADGAFVSRVHERYGGENSVSWGGKDLHIRPLFGRPVSGRGREESVVFEGIAPGVDSVVVALHDRLEEFLVADDARRVPILEYAVRLPAWVSRIRQLDGGWVEFWDGQAAWLRAEVPQAKDRRGTVYRGRAVVAGAPGAASVVPGGLEWNAAGGEIRVRFELALARAEGPVVVDPGWGATGAMAVGRYLHNAVLLPSGKVLAVGGSDSVVSLSSCEIYDPLTGTWSGTTSMATPRYTFHLALLANGKVLAAGGYNSASGSYTSSCELYDPATGLWSPTGSMIGARGYLVGTLLASGKVLVAGGYLAGPLATAEVYDPALGTWSATSNTMTGARYLHTATQLADGKVLVAGGNNGSYVNTCSLYDPATNSWSAANSLAGARGYHVATLLPTGKVLVAGGYSGGALATAEQYDPATGLWSAAGSLSGARYVHAATLLPSGKVLVAGGNNGTAYLNTCEVYDSSTNTWSSATPMAGARGHNAATVLANGRVLISGGYGTTALATCEPYEPGGRWSATGTLADARYYHTATLLPTGKVLVAGGVDGASLASCELYDPATGSWTATGSLTDARNSHMATLLSNGKVLVTGGFNGTYPLSSCEIYDPATGLWTATGSLNAARYLHSATLLPSGKVLVTGGVNSVTLSSCEVFDPATGAWSTTGSLAAPRYYHTALLLPSGQVLVAAGYSGAAALSACELFDSALGMWLPTGAMLAARYNHTATLLSNGRVLVVGGSPAGASCELFDPAAGWSATGALTIGRIYHTATLLPNGKILVAGDSTASACEIYDSSSGWAPTGAMTAPRYYQTATLLPTGKVLVAGGVAAGALATCELYDGADGALDAWKPSITSVDGLSTFPASLSFGDTVTLAGARFGSLSEGGSGNVQSSRTKYPPRVALMGLSSGGGGAADSTLARYFGLTTDGWFGGASLDVTLPGSGNNPQTYYMMFVLANGLASEGRIVALGSGAGPPPPPPLPPPPSITSLSQRRVNGTTLILTGGSTAEGAVTFLGEAETDSFPFKLQVEIRALGTDFTGAVSAESGLVAAGTPASISFSIGDGSYHWQARAVNSFGTAGSWTSYGGNAETSADLVAAAGASAVFSPAAGAATSVTKKESCGLVGWEPLLLFVLLRRRRRSARS